MTSHAVNTAQRILQYYASFSYYVSIPTVYPMFWLLLKDQVIYMYINHENVILLMFDLYFQMISASNDLYCKIPNGFYENGFFLSH